MGIHRVDPRTGDTTPIALAGPEQADPHFSYRALSWSPDGQRLYFRRLIRTGPRTFDQAILRFDLATGRETELLHVPGSNRYGVYGDWIAVSPDGRYLAVKVPSTSEQREPLRCAGTG